MRAVSNTTGNMTDQRQSGGASPGGGVGQRDPAPEAQRMNPLPRIQVALPKGFRQIVENLSREVMRSQPGDINEFAVEYFAKLLKARDQGVIDVIQATIADATKLNPYNYTQPAAQTKDAVNVVTSQYKNPDEGTFDTQAKSHQAAATIQKAAKSKKGKSKQAAENEPQEMKNEEQTPAPSDVSTINTTTTMQTGPSTDKTVTTPADDTTTTARTDDETSAADTT